MGLNQIRDFLYKLLKVGKLDKTGEVCQFLADQLTQFHPLISILCPPITTATPKFSLEHLRGFVC